MKRGEVWWVRFGPSAGGKDLAVKASIEATVSILFGLDVSVSENILKEVLMKDSIVSSCARCEAAFLRGPGGFVFNPSERLSIAKVFAEPGETPEGFDSPPSHPTN